MCEAYNAQYHTNFFSVMPTNLYGPHDNFDLENSHVLSALMRKIHLAKKQGEKTVTVWGTGKPLREFLHVDDLADACVFMMTKTDTRERVNIGSGQEVTIKELAEIMCDAIGFNGELVFDTAKPDGAPRKLLDSSTINALGWHAKIGLKAGIQRTYEWFCEVFDL